MSTHNTKPQFLRKWGAIIQSVFSIAILIGLWELAAKLFKVPVYLLPAPTDIYAALAKLKSGLLLSHIGATLKTIGLGFAFSIITSIPLAILITSSKLVSRLVYPLLILSQSIPKVALAPILIILMGANESPRILITFLVAFFPLVIATASGLMATPPELVELSRSYRAGRLKEFTKIRLPYAVPFIFSGLKVAGTLAVVGAVVGEFVAANKGLGYLITTSMAFSEPAVAWGAVVLLAFMGMVLFLIISVLEKVLFPWAQTDNISEAW